MTKEHHLSKTTYQYKDGILVGVFESVREAQRKTGILACDISRCCIGKNRTAGGYIWSYAYVGDKNVAEEGWINNVSIFLN